jgi:hypothetical protein
MPNNRGWSKRKSENMFKLLERYLDDLCTIMYKLPIDNRKKINIIGVSSNKIYGKFYEN